MYRHFQQFTDEETINFSLSETSKVLNEFSIHLKENNIKLLS